MARSMIANEEQPDHYGARHEKRTIVQNGLEIHRATGETGAIL
jgi:hypothetical protein